MLNINLLGLVETLPGVLHGFGGSEYGVCFRRCLKKFTRTWSHVKFRHFIILLLPLVDILHNFDSESVVYSLRKNRSNSSDMNPT